MIVLLVSAALEAQVGVADLQKADANGDFIVNAADVALCRAAYNAREGQAAYNGRCDMDGNRLINVADLSFI